MKATSNHLAAWVLALGLTASATGCVAAAAAGAAGAIYATSRGVESLVASPIDQVAARSAAVMREMGIAQDASSTEQSGAKRELKGKQGDLDVTIQLEQQDTATTKVEVYARKNLAEWDKDYAHRVLEGIVKK
jgi:protein-tyrosine-phosphatase